jgi:tubulin epsilon
MGSNLTHAFAGGVVQETLRGPLGGLFEPSQTVTDVSGAGNNWAHGHLEYGPRHADAVRSWLRG